MNRPAYHYAPRRNWLSDPNGLVWHEGEWHLFYQYNPLGDQWGHMAWGHAVSGDLLRWRELPPALTEDDRHMIFSGSAVVDSLDSAGFGTDALVAHYTGAERGEGGRQVQCLAFSNDRGRNWTKFAGNPVLDRGTADFRDPNVFWHQPSGHWIMVVALSGENRALIYRSRDLRHWQEMSSIGPYAIPGHVWECPTLIELPVEGTHETRWLFKVDALHDAPGSGALALTGRFDGRSFVPDLSDEGLPRCRVADHGRDFYAAIPWHEPRDDAGRPVWIGWMGNHDYQASLPARGWRGAMSLPRRLSLRREADGFDLVQRPDPALESLIARDAIQSGIVAGERHWHGLPHAFRLRIEPSGEGSLTVEIGREQARLSISFDMPAGRITLDRVVAGNASPGMLFDAPILARWRHQRGCDIDLWIDYGSIEIFAEAGSLALTAQTILPAGPLDLRVAADGGAAVAIMPLVRTDGTESDDG